MKTYENMPKRCPGCGHRQGVAHDCWRDDNHAAYRRGYAAGLEAAAVEVETFPDQCHGEDRESEWNVSDLSAAIRALKEKP